MKHLQINEEATKTFMKLISGLSETGAHKTLDKHNYLPKRKGGIMSVHVECIGKGRFSVAHYFEQECDLMSDPQMTFWTCDGRVFPASFTQHGGIPIFQNALLFDEHDQPHSANAQMIQELSVFANDWMNNIKDQQEI